MERIRNKSNKRQMLLDWLGEDDPHSNGTFLRKCTVKELDKIIAANGYDIDEWFDDEDASHKRRCEYQLKQDKKFVMWNTLNQVEKILCHRLYMKSVEDKCRENETKNAQLVEDILAGRSDIRFVTFLHTFKYTLNLCWENPSLIYLSDIVQEYMTSRYDLHYYEDEGKTDDEGVA